MPGAKAHILLLLLMAAASTAGQCQDAGMKAAKWYYQASQLFDSHTPTAETDSLALLYCNNAIQVLEHAPAHTNDLLLFQALEKKGNLLDIKKQYIAAMAAYNRALVFQKACRNLCDSLVFALNVFAASTQYNLNNLDSASMLLLSAEALTDRFPGVQQKERMYNALGALYFEKGNYHQSRNYFSKALQTISAKGSAYTMMQINFETNIASSLCKLDMYHEALDIYQRILLLKGAPNYIYFNIGKVYADMGDPEKALLNFRKVTVKDYPSVLNETAYAHLKAGKPDSAAYYLEKFRWYNQGNKLNVLDNGMNDLYWSALLESQQRYRQSLDYLQKAIIIFSGSFSTTDIYANPSTFDNTFNPYNLYNALYKKAAVCKSLYSFLQSEAYLELSLQTYQSALSLIQYIEKSYDTDDSKMFLKKQKQEVYEKAVETALQLYQLHPEKDYLEQAFLIAEKNKGSIVAASLAEKAVEDLSDNDKKLVEEERTIRYQIAKLKISHASIQGQSAKKAAAAMAMDDEIRLSQVQKKLEKNRFYYNLKYDDSYPSVPTLQKKLSAHQALISFQVSGQLLRVFVLTQTSFTYSTIHSFPQVRTQVRNWLNLLQANTGWKKKQADSTAGYLYRTLIYPLQQLAGNKDEWIIIPDDILCYLPFESLPSGADNKFLLQTVQVSYQFSSRFISDENYNNNNKPTDNVLAFAPFADMPHSSSTAATNAVFEPLPDSYNEVKNVQGKLYTGANATKKQFLQEASGFPIIHLATHAVSDIANSNNSYIAFYPSTAKQDQDRLFLGELYCLNLSKTELVIVSACETGNGEWVSNEGVISIARGFSYAGCASTINSLWKADDKATAFILSRFHAYLNQGLSKSKALQQAKIDFIESDAVYKTPNYWAHLVLTGNNRALYNSQPQPILYGASLAILVLTGMVYTRRKKTARASVLH